MKDLSIIIPARNEIFLEKTINNILENIEADTEIIVILDGYWPEPSIKDHEKVIFIHYTNPIGQRAAINKGVNLSNAKYIMKLDAHCALDKGFDKKLIEIGEYNNTIIPLMYNLHAFDWQCIKCGHRIYQGPKPEKCEKCENISEFKIKIVWQPRWNRVTYSWRFDKNMQFQYWLDHRKRPETHRGNFIETLSFVGACWFMNRERYLEIEGLDEKHGFWGQVGTEIACKTWLSGGKLLTYKKTWFSHMFRTRKGFSFPYHMTVRQVNKARNYSKDLWLNDKWHKAIYPLSWLIDKFAPVPDWHET